MPGDDTEPFLEQWCDSSIPGITLTEGEKAYYFTYDFGQEGMTWDIELFQAFAFHTIHGDSISGEIQLMNVSEDESYISVVSFVWEPYENWCHFSGEPTANTFYVNEERVDFYETVEEDCEGLWNE